MSSVRVRPTSRDDVQRRSPLRVVGSYVLAALIAAGGGLVVGGLTSPAQGVLPEFVNSFANSAGGWTALGFLLVWLSRARPVFAAVLGAASLVLMVEGYRIVSEWRGFSYGEPFQDEFTYIGLVVGPIIGACAALVRWGRPTTRALAVVPLAVVLVGEAAYGLVFVAESTGYAYWIIQGLGGIAALTAAIVRERPRPLVAVAMVLVTLAGAAAFVLSYWGLGQLAAGML